MTLNSDDFCKHGQIYAQLLESFSSGKYKIGERVPSEREVAAALQVNIRTVRRAFRDLILGGIVEKKVGSGTYLKAFPHIAWEKKPVNVIISNDYAPQGRRMIEHLLPEIAAEKGRSVRLINVAEKEVDKILRSAIALEQSSILCLINLDDARAVFENPKLFAAISNNSSLRGVPCVMCDDRKGITKLVRHLQNDGHRRIALVKQCSKFGDGVSSLQAEAWREALGRDFDPELEISLPETRDDYIRSAYSTVREKIAGINFSAMICTIDELMYGAMAAIRESGKRIPEDIAIASIGNSPLAEFAAPPVTSCDPSFAEHLRAAFDLLKYNYNHPDALETSRLIQPEIIIRKSTDFTRKGEEK